MSFIASTVSALRPLPPDGDSQRCVRLFLFGASMAFDDSQPLNRQGFALILALSLERHGLQRTETTRLIESLPELRKDPFTSYMLDQGAQAMAEHLAGQDSVAGAPIRERITDWRRAGVCCEDV